MRIRKEERRESGTNDDRGRREEGILITCSRRKFEGFGMKKKMGEGKKQNGQEPLCMNAFVFSLFICACIKNEKNGSSPTTKRETAICMNES